MRATYKKFSTGFWSQSLHEKTHKTREYSEAWQSFRSLIFKNLLESHFCFNKKCFAGRMVLIQCALRSVGQMICFTYPERMRTTYKKFSTAFWSQSLCQKRHKMAEYSDAWQSFRSLIFKNLLESHFSFNKKCFVGRMVLIQSALYFPDLGECFTYP